MGIEIERKFLVRGEGWRTGAETRVIRQGFLSTDPDRTVRVRVAGDRGYLTVKGRAEGLVRAEFEYPIPVEDANAMLDRLCLRPLIEKTRHRVEHAGLVWEVDEFHGENQGLVLAEVELDDPGAEVRLPPWTGEEVSGDPRYYNANLVRHPFAKW
ncbi:MAG: CYTH domain-containing protein [Proteobacteria bacterium]|nr:CYTH domain-containing protein [Pseudomonadota bacterium]